MEVCLSLKLKRLAELNRSDATEAAQKRALGAFVRTFSEAGFEPMIDLKSGKIRLELPCDDLDEAQMVFGPLFDRALDSLKGAIYQDHHPDDVQMFREDHEERNES